MLTATKGDFTQSVAITDWSGAAIDNLGLFETTGGYNLAFVPEPAEWASIFSALVLGFVFFKRRNFRK